MGVMSCSRKGCERIMCDIYVPSVGYVCYECKNEFKKYLDSIDKPHLTELEIMIELEKFMNTTKGEFEDVNPMNIDEFFDNYDIR